MRFSNTFVTDFSGFVSNSNRFVTYLHRFVSESDSLVSNSYSFGFGFRYFNDLFNNLGLACNTENHV